MKEIKSHSLLFKILYVYNNNNNNNEEIMFKTK
jgi:hypothetical protein